MSTIYPAKEIQLRKYAARKIATLRYRTTAADWLKAILLGELGCLLFLAIDLLLHGQ